MHIVNKLNLITMNFKCVFENILDLKLCFDNERINASVSIIESAASQSIVFLVANISVNNSRRWRRRL